MKFAFIFHGRINASVLKVKIQDSVKKKDTNSDILAEASATPTVMEWFRRKYWSQHELIP